MQPSHVLVNAVKHQTIEYQNSNTLSDSCCSKQWLVGVVGTGNDRRRHKLRWLLPLLGESRSYSNELVVNNDYKTGGSNSYTD